MDWNKSDNIFFGIGESHSLRGSVDWNNAEEETEQWINVTPYAGVWIEIITNQIKRYVNNSHSLRGSVDWNIEKEPLG